MPRILLAGVGDTAPATLVVETMSPMRLDLYVNRTLCHAAAYAELQAALDTGRESCEGAV